MELTVEDQTSSATDSTYQKIYVAVDEEKYSCEYYFMKVSVLSTIRINLSRAICRIIMDFIWDRDGV